MSIQLLNLPCATAFHVSKCCETAATSHNRRSKPFVKSMRLNDLNHARLAFPWGVICTIRHEARQMSHSPDCVSEYSTTIDAFRKPPIFECRGCELSLASTYWEKLRFEISMTKGSALGVKIKRNLSRCNLCIACKLSILRSLCVLIIVFLLLRFCFWTCRKGNECSKRYIELFLRGKNSEGEIQPH